MTLFKKPGRDNKSRTRIPPNTNTRNPTPISPTFLADGRVSVALILRALTTGTSVISTLSCSLTSSSFFWRILTSSSWVLLTNELDAFLKCSIRSMYSQSQGHISSVGFSVVVVVVDASQLTVSSWVITVKKSDQDLESEYFFSLYTIHYYYPAYIWYRITWVL